MNSGSEPESSSAEYQLVSDPLRLDAMLEHLLPVLQLCLES